MQLQLGLKSDPVEYRYSYEWLFRLMEQEQISHLQLGTFFEIYQLPDAWFADLRRKAADHGVSITSVFTAHRELGGFFRDDGPGFVAVARKTFERLIDVSGLLGARFVGSNPGAVLRDRMGTKAQGSETYLRNFRDLQRRAGDLGIEWLTIEPMSCLAKYGVQYVSVHVETMPHADRVLAMIRDHGMKAGLGFSPGTPLDSLDYLVPRLDFVLIMTVNPGFAGQKLVPTALKKIADCRARPDALGADIPIQVDGNVSFENIPAMVAAGGDWLIAGTSSLFSKQASRRDNTYALQCALALGARKVILINRGKERLERVMQDFSDERVVGLLWTEDVVEMVLAECKPFNEPHFVMINASAEAAYKLGTRLMGYGTVLDAHAGVKGAGGKPRIEHTVDMNNDIHYRSQCYQATHGSGMHGIRLAHQLLAGKRLPRLHRMTYDNERFHHSQIHKAIDRAADSDSLKIIINWED